MRKLQELTVSQQCEFEGHGALAEVVGSTNKFTRNLYSANWYSEYDDKTLVNSLRYFLLSLHIVQSQQYTCKKTKSLRVQRDYKTFRDYKFALQSIFITVQITFAVISVTYVQQDSHCFQTLESFHCEELRNFYLHRVSSHKTDHDKSSFKSE